MLVEQTGQQEQGEQVVLVMSVEETLPHDSSRLLLQLQDFIDSFQVPFIENIGKNYIRRLPFLSVVPFNVGGS